MSEASRTSALVDIGDVHTRMYKKCEIKIIHKIKSVDVDERFGEVCDIDCYSSLVLLTFLCNASEEDDFLGSVMVYALLVPHSVRLNQGQSYVHVHVML